MSNVQDAPVSSLPPLLVHPPWTWEPVVLKGLEPPDAPTVVSLPEGTRKSFLQDAPAEPSGKGHDWNATAERIRSGKPLTDLTANGRATLYTRLLVHGPDDLAAEALEDRRYWDDLGPKHVRAIVARHELAAHPLALHAARADEHETMRALAPFLDAEVAGLMVGFSDPKWADRGHSTPWTWLRTHGPAAAPFLLPYALGEPGHEREFAERMLRELVRSHGHATVAEAAARHGGRRWIIGREVAAKQVVGLEFSPGIVLRDPASEPVQTIRCVELRRDLFDRDDRSPFGELDPVVASEILADLTGN
ncbi:hypothetical protein GCM10010191_80350 [Actinomadura vinacea]|uniref:DUF4263 domain-containing protein n=1 Tax=Actinomadura vinacea TaxID=115336 RepID=A0ABP5XAI8_9ACTN